MGGGNGLAGSDASELAALGAVFGEASPAIAALKAITGECICASGPLQVAAAVLSFEQGTPAGELVRGSPGASASGVLCSAVSWEGAAGALMVCAPGSSVP
jgi:3-oxoacyl-(acyl-carrier-protein) synthase